jgi:hypothetical protein
MSVTKRVAHVELHAVVDAVLGRLAIGVVDERFVDVDAEAGARAELLHRRDDETTVTRAQVDHVVGRADRRELKHFIDDGSRRRRKGRDRSNVVGARARARQCEDKRGRRR